MCNWSDGIVDRVTEKATQQVTNKMIIRNVENVVSSCNVPIEKAYEILKYNPAEYYAAKEFCTS